MWRLNSEHFAKACVEGLDSRYRLRPILNQSNGEHDFGLLVNGVPIGAMEVGSLTDSDFASMTAALYGSRGHGERVLRVLCKQTWHVTTSRGANIRRIHDELDARLSQLEAADLTGFGRMSRDASAQAIRRELRLASGRVIETSDPSWHWIGLPVLSGWLGPDLVNEAVNQVANRPDNLRKLSSMACAQRHLFVFVDMSVAEVWSVVTSPELDIGLAPEPLGATQLWVGAHSERASEATVLRARPGHPWQRQQVAICDSYRRGT